LLVPLDRNLGNSVLLVTGAYYPEIGASGLQCRTVARALSGRVRFGVLTTAVDRSLPDTERVDDVDVYRIGVDVRSRRSKASATARILRRMLAIGGAYDLIHLHGFSQKNLPVMLAARLMRKRTLMTLHTAGHDEPEPVRARGRLAYRAFAAVDLVLPVSPQLRQRCLDAGLPPDRVRLVPNGIDTDRFRPLGAEARATVRRRLGWTDDLPVILFVGFFSPDKRPDMLFRAFRRLAIDHRTPARLVFAGATESTYFEIDRTLAESIRQGAAAAGLADRVQFVEPTHDIVTYFQAADVFALPSAREANPLALLEAMACGLPSVASDLHGATDAIVDEGVNGTLVPADDEAAWAAALRRVIADPAYATRLGERARDTIERRFGVERAAGDWLAAYRDVLGPAWRS
jgi:glycosyltransferase involved in cell wall biosynthesis